MYSLKRKHDSGHEGRSVKMHPPLSPLSPMLNGDKPEGPLKRKHYHPHNSNRVQVQQLPSPGSSVASDDTPPVTLNRTPDSLCDTQRTETQHLASPLSFISRDEAPPALLGRKHGLLHGYQRDRIHPLPSPVSLTASAETPPVPIRAKTVYQAANLNRRKREIRLVELVQNPEDEMITLKFHRKTDQDEIKYTALSYTWGDATRTRQVILEGKIFEIRQNLWQFLYQARKHSWYKLLWIDAICIDQDDAEERKHQVALMGSIYSEAEQVAIWLGPAAWNSDVAVHYLSGSEKTYAKSVSWVLKELLGITPPEPTMGYHSSILEETELDSSTAIAQSIRDECLPFGGVDGNPPAWMKPLTDIRTRSMGTKEGIVNAILDICERPYWRRLWIVQEVILGKKMILHCGERSIQGHRFVNLFKQLYDILPLVRDGWIRGRLRKIPAASIIQQRIGWHKNPGFRGFEIRDLLKAHDFRECSDPRDKLYGLLSLADKRELELFDISADYTKPVSGIYHQLISGWRSIYKGGDAPVVMLSAIFQLPLKNPLVWI